VSPWEAADLLVDRRHSWHSLGQLTELLLLSWLKNLLIVAWCNDIFWHVCLYNCHFYPLARHVWALLLQTATCSRRFRLSAYFFLTACSPCLGSLAPNGYLLVSILLLGDKFFIRLLAMFGPWAPNDYLLVSIPPHGDIYFLSACSPCLGPGLRTAICSRRFHLSAIFIFLSTCSPCFGPGLQTYISRRIHYSTLRPHLPLTAIFLWPCGLAPSRQYSFGLAAKINFIFASRRMSILFSHAPSQRNRLSICLTVNVIFFSRPLTANSIFYSPHGGCSFYYSSASSQRYFIRASWR